MSVLKNLIRSKNVSDNTKSVDLSFELFDINKDFSVISSLLNNQNELKDIVIKDKFTNVITKVKKNEEPFEEKISRLKKELDEDTVSTPKNDKVSFDISSFLSYGQSEKDITGNLKNCVEEMKVFAKTDEILSVAKKCYEGVINALENIDSTDDIEKASDNIASSLRQYYGLIYKRLGTKGSGEVPNELLNKDIIGDYNINKGGVLLNNHVLYTTYPKNDFKVEKNDRTKGIGEIFKLAEYSGMFFFLGSDKKPPEMKETSTLSKSDINEILSLTEECFGLLAKVDVPRDYKEILQADKANKVMTDLFNSDMVDKLPLEDLGIYMHEIGASMINKIYNSEVGFFFILSSNIPYLLNFCEQNIKAYR